MNAANGAIAMHNTLIRIAIALLTSFIVAGCGQKGPLFLPGDPSTIRTITPEQNTEQSEERDEDDEDETPITIQN